MSELIIYGHWVSQPSRAVMWLCLENDSKFTFKEVDPMSGGTKTPEFLSLTSIPTIPTISDGDFNLSESNAILIYLAEKYNWSKWYPNNFQTRAKINQYLHWHHFNTRFLTIKLFRPAFIAAIKKKDFKEVIKNNANSIINVFNHIESWLSKSQFLCTNDFPTVADIACYCEMDQLKILNMYDFSPYPNITRWMNYIEALPHYEESHQALNFLNGFFAKRASAL